MRVTEWISQVLYLFARKNKSIDISISNKMETAISRWSQAYNGESEWVNENVKSLSLPAAISSEFARLVTLEIKTEITGSERAEYLNDQYKNTIKDLRRNVEFGCAKGGIIFKPYVNGNNIIVGVNQADTFFPTAFDTSGRMTGCIFYEQVLRDSRIYTRVESHNLTGNQYTITNKAFASNTKTAIGDEIPLQSISEWEDIEPVTIINDTNLPLFAYFKVPIANTIDQTSPLGVSVFSRSEGLIKDADEQYSRLLWEFEGAELAIDAATEYLESKPGNPMEMPKKQDRLFRRLDIDTPTNGTPFYNVYNPTIRDTSLVNGLNRIFQRIEFNCNLAYGTLSDPQNVDKTAEEIKSSKQRSYAAVSDMQKSLESALIDLVAAMDVLTTLYNLAPAGKYEIKFGWDDSLISDRKSEFAEKLQLTQAGALGLDELRSWYTGEEIETARQNLPGVQVEE